MPVWALAVYALATARLVGLVVDDEITRPPREWFLARLDDGKPAQFVASLISCVWCCGLWISAVVALLAYWWCWSPWLLIPALALAFSQVVGMIASIGRG